MEREKCCYVLGAGGHAKVVISTLRAVGYTILEVYDDDPYKWGRTCLGVSISGPISKIEQSFSASAVVAIGDNRVRQTIVSKLTQVCWVTAVHPSAVVDSSVQLGVGTVIFAGAVIQPETRVGDHVIVNTGTTVDHDNIIDSYVHLAPGVHLAGNVTVEEGAFLGISSVVTPGVSIGSWAVVGAGSVVIRNIVPHATAVGVPARIIKEHKCHS